jgi:hypothetical protein
MPKPTFDRSYEHNPDGSLTVREDSAQGSRQWDIPASQITGHERMMDKGQPWDDIPAGVRSAARDAANEARARAEQARAERLDNAGR